MGADVAPNLSPVDRYCRDGWTVCHVGDEECIARAKAAGARYVERHGAVEYYCAPDSTGASPSGLGWTLIAAAVLLVGGVVLLRRRGKAK